VKCKRAAERNVSWGKNEDRWHAKPSGEKTRFGRDCLGGRKTSGTPVSQANAASSRGRRLRPKTPHNVNAIKKRFKLQINASRRNSGQKKGDAGGREKGRKIKPMPTSHVGLRVLLRQREKSKSSGTLDEGYSHQERKTRSTTDRERKGITKAKRTRSKNKMWRRGNRIRSTTGLATPSEVKPNQEGGTNKYKQTARPGQKTKTKHCSAGGPEQGESEA